MSRAGSPKRHYIPSRDAKETACRRVLKANLTVTVTLDPARVTCTNCQKNMKENI